MIEQLNDIKHDYGEDSQEYKAQQKKVEKQLIKSRNDLVNAMGNIVYHFIGGNSFKDAANALMNRSNEIERQFGKFGTDEFKRMWGADKTSREKIGNAIDNMSYVLGFISRSHSALKSFPARTFFVSSFMARLQAAADAGHDITDRNNLILIADESYLDWERGKYQQKNMISDWWNDIVKKSEEKNQLLAQYLRAQIPITKVPVNMLHEALFEYIAGMFRRSEEHTSELQSH